MRRVLRRPRRYTSAHSCGLQSELVDGERVRWTAAQVAAWNELLDHYATWLGRGVSEDGLRGPRIDDPADIRAVASYVAWSTWVATAPRPGADYSYTNNWPPDEAVGNTMTAEALLWSALSLIALLGGIGATMFAFGRSRKLGWHRDEDEPRELVFRDPSEIRLTPAQRATRLVLPRGHRPIPRARPMRRRECALPRRSGEFLRDRSRSLVSVPVTRTWHLQLAIFSSRRPTSPWGSSSRR